MLRLILLTFLLLPSLATAQTPLEYRRFFGAANPPTCPAGRVTGNSWLTLCVLSEDWTESKFMLCALEGRTPSAKLLEYPPFCDPSVPGCNWYGPALGGCEGNTTGIDPAIRFPIAACDDQWTPPKLVWKKIGPGPFDWGHVVECAPKPDKNSCRAPTDDPAAMVSVPNNYQTELDYSPPIPQSTNLSLVRHYNSGTTARRTALGLRWRHTFDRSIETRVGSNSVYALRSDGRTVKFTLMNGMWTPDADVTDKLTQHFGVDGKPIGWIYATKEGEEETYSSNGKLGIITSASKMQTLFYTDGTAAGGFPIDMSASTVTAATTPLPPGLLIRVEDSLNARALTFGYDAASRLVQIVDPDGWETTYSYDANGNLATVLYPDNTARIYHYGEPEHLAGAAATVDVLTGVSDGNGERLVTYSYDLLGVATTQYAADKSGKPTLDPLEKEYLNQKGKDIADFLLKAPAQAQVNLSCANFFQCYVLHSHNLHDLIFAKCQELATNNPFIQATDKVGAINVCNTRCPIILREKCRANPNACVGEPIG